MAPKKKNNKKDDDWESEVAEAPKATAESDTTGAPAEADPVDEFPGGGLMAMMRKRQKKKNKGKQEGDTVEGEDAPVNEESDLATKAPVEASIDDEFDLPEKKGKGKAPAAKSAKQEDDDDDERGADGKVLTKAQKEKAKKEREKQRKKENVWLQIFTRYMNFANFIQGCEKEGYWSCCKGSRCHPHRRSKSRRAQCCKTSCGWQRQEVAPCAGQTTT
jgi:hypothetical protein